jgi:hypothetical protein
MALHLVGVSHGFQGVIYALERCLTRATRGVATRLARAKPSPQLGFVRRLPGRPFDKLAAILLDRSFRVVRGAIIPFEAVQAGASWVDSVRAWRFILRDPVWQLPSVLDVTPDLLLAQQRL